jgi:hypothetical protein
MAEVALLGLVGFFSEYAQPNRLFPFGFRLPFFPSRCVHVEQPVHLAVTCQWVLFIFVPAL